jgi:formate hydrogenlyase subunit 6/NADH:ubiquinone oxidoreductase subunit I
VRWILEREHFDRLLGALGQNGYRLLGPMVREGSIVYGEVLSASDFPIGWTDEQEGASYRLRRRSDEALFGFVVGPHSAKQFFHPPAVRLWRAKRAEQLFQIEEERSDIPKIALIGLRSCDLHAIATQDRVFLKGPFADPWYRARREASFLVAINCGKAGGTCFCVSMNTGPKASSGFDLALTEILQDGRHYFVVEAGSERGAAILRDAPCRAARPDEEEAAELVTERTAGQMGRTMDTTGIKELLDRNYEHPRWENVAERCLACTNCTMVCPTCFCTTVEDSADLAGGCAERWQKWDSCFTMDFSYIHGGSVRSSTKARYRQWMTHKLATWIDQFSTSGCVGCGRCITWCPVAIDITEEVRAIRESERPPAGAARREGHGDS